MMNAYTLDPSKTESTAPVPNATAPTSVTPSAPTPMVAPTYMPPNYSYYPYPYQYPHPYPQPQVPSTTAQQDASKIRDWLAWSIINIFLAGLIPGILPLIFTLVCRSKKKKNDINGARTMSTLALVFNIICTILGIVAIIGIFIYLFVITKRLGNDASPFYKER